MNTMNLEIANAANVWFTSDTHFSHRNIIKYCDRPFDGTDHMDEVIINRWNSLVGPNDTVFHLGDIALGPIDSSLAKVARLNGHKVAVLGNHDRPFMRAGKADENEWWDRYEEVFQAVYHWKNVDNYITLDGVNFNLSHFPYSGDHTPEDRHSDARPIDNENPLIHGHTHTKDRLTFSKNGTAQVHVGQDAWDFRPVHADQILALLS